MVAPPLRWDAAPMKSISPSLLVTAPEDRVFYVESSLPPGLTLNEYRRGRRLRTSRWGRLKRLAGSGAAPATA
jgi:hypothetical protein